jgi:hypothetical protein
VACEQRIDCLRQLPVERVEDVLLEMMGLQKDKPRLQARRVRVTV